MNTVVGYKRLVYNSGMARLYARFRPGFSMIEVVVAVAVVAIIAAILVSSDTPESLNDQARYDAAAEALANLSRAAAGYEASKAPRSFHQVVGVYPGRLSDLTTMIKQSQNNLCGVAYSGPVTTAASNLGKWQSSTNPFYGSQLLTTGTPIAPGFTVQDLLVLGHAVTTSSSTWANTMAIRMPIVAQRDAVGLDLAVDGVINNALGIVQYTASDPTVVDYLTTITASNNGIQVFC
jgi:prepilin-type N-terminal cleavage/methylation domain-containing protein